MGMQNLEDQKRIAVAFATMAINDRDPAGAVARYVGTEYIQHNPGTPDGPEAFIREMQELFVRAPEFKMHVKRVVAEGDLVIVHNLCIMSPSDRGMAGFDMFRFRDGKIVEHWDARQPVPERSANANTMF